MNSSNPEFDDSLVGLPISRGHFLLESGLHADTWMDLDTMFLDPMALAPRIAALAALLTEHRPSAVCGPLLGGAFVAQAVATHLGLRFYVAERARSGPGEGLFQAEYHLPPGQRAHAPQERFAVVDDIVSAGSSVRATVGELTKLGATVVVVGALLRLGDRATRHFTASGIPVVSTATRAFTTWEPNVCPHCRAGTLLVERQG